MSNSAPEVFTTVVDEAYLDALFSEVESRCGKLVVRLRGRDEQQSASAAVTLVDARRALNAGAGVQLRYEHDGVAWSDTLRVTAEGVQLIRCQLPEA